MVNTTELNVNDAVTVNNEKEKDDRSLHCTYYRPSSAVYVSQA